MLTSFNALRIPLEGSLLPDGGIIPCASNNASYSRHSECPEGFARVTDDEEGDPEQDHKGRNDVHEVLHFSVHDTTALER